ncbi:MAG: hypothetical protein L6R38_006461 [Xanthoria sp. 2 TBL-2021]|nr:MAG: hypothetical protein L6R38_006461 [Xanthoria sp. 2 TBL-2021]
MYTSYIELFTFFVGTLVARGVGIAVNKEYLILPKVGITPPQVDGIFELLGIWVDGGKRNVETVIPNGSAAEDSVTDDAQIDTARTAPSNQSEVNFTANSAYVTQFGAFEDLPFVSQPRSMMQLD